MQLNGRKNEVETKTQNTVFQNIFSHKNASSKLFNLYGACNFKKAFYRKILIHTSFQIHEQESKDDYNAITVSDKTHISSAEYIESS